MMAPLPNDQFNISDFSLFHVTLDEYSPKSVPIMRTSRSSIAHSMSYPVKTDHVSAQQSRDFFPSLVRSIFEVCFHEGKSLPVDDTLSSLAPMRRLSWVSTHTVCNN